MNSASAVRLSQGTLPFRLMAAEYGADLTYGEEIIDHKMLKCVRRANGKAAASLVPVVMPPIGLIIARDDVFFFVRRTAYWFVSLCL